MGNQKKKSTGESIKIACEAADYLQVNALKNFQGELKKVSKENLQKLKNNIVKYGFSAPIFVWKNKGINYILDGHGRIKAVLDLEKEGYTIPSLPVAWIKARSKTEAKKKLLQIASQYGEMTVKGLELFLDETDIELGEIGMDLELPGIEIRYSEEETADDDLIPEKVKAITKLGDLWELNGHRVLCGDSVDAEQVGRLMAGQKADMVFTDPPYNVGYKYNSYNDKKSNREYANFCNAYFKVMMRYANKAIITTGYGNERYYPEAVASAIYLKTNSMTHGSLFNFMCYEPILFWGNHKKKARNNNIFDYPISNQKDTGKHPCPKPIRMITDIVESFAKEKGKILDIFLGSGSTIIACEKTGRICYGMEIEPYYVDVTVRRWIEWCEKNERKCKIKKNEKPFKQ